MTIGGQALDYEDAAASFVTGTPETATTTPFMSSLSVGDIEVDGASLAGSACVSAMTINIDNSVQLQRCLGSTKLGPGAIIETEAAITGSITLAWSAKAYSIWKEQIKRTKFAVEFPIVDSIGNSYTQATQVAADKNQEVAETVGKLSPDSSGSANGKEKAKSKA